jgi:hypothetical protein
LRREIAYLLFGLIGVAVAALIWRSVRHNRRRISSLRVNLFRKRDD